MPTKFEIKNIPKKDLLKAFKYYKEYTEGGPFSYFKKQYKKHPNLFVGCYHDKKLIGICIGFEMKRVSKDAIILISIAVDKNYQRSGLGTKMIKFFKQKVKETGKKKISVASAGGYVEKFYQKTAFKPKFILLRVYRKDLPSNYKNFGYEIASEKVYGKIKKIYIKVKKYSPKLREKLKKKFKAYEVNYIFEKEV